MSSSQPARLNQLDALRGLAALAVVFYHLTTRMQELFPEAPRPSWSLPFGHFGVNLFFIISGFVIFMTMARTERPADFVVSRVSRLYPAYWAAIALTFVITHALALPIKTVSLGTALANGLMFHGFFRVPHVDGVYWTLEVELCFYVLILLLFMAGQLQRIHALLLGLLAMRLAYHLAATVWQVEFSWMLSRLLILPYIPWFALGICIFQWTRPGRPSGAWGWPLLTALASLASLGLTYGLGVLLLGLGFGALVGAAALGRVPLLGGRLFVWLGAISYPLYLLHENIGWSLMLQLTGTLGLPADLALVVTLALVLALSDLVSRLVERPAMAMIRRWYKRRAPQVVAAGSR